MGTMLLSPRNEKGGEKHSKCRRRVKSPASEKNYRPKVFWLDFDEERKKKKKYLFSFFVGIFFFGLSKLNQLRDDQVNNSNETDSRSNSRRNEQMREPKQNIIMRWNVHSNDVTCLSPSIGRDTKKIVRTMFLV